MYISQYCFCGVAVFSRNITLNLSGRKWQKSVQKLDDKDAFVISKCLKNNRLVTGKHTDSGESPNCSPVPSGFFVFVFFNRS